MTIYISGKMTGIKNYNKKQFMRTERYLKKMGFNVVNPWRLSKDLNKSIKKPTYGDYLEYDLKWLAKCDAIYLMQGWEDSNGACVEYEFAIENGIFQMGYIL